MTSSKIFYWLEIVSRNIFLKINVLDLYPVNQKCHVNALVKNIQLLKLLKSCNLNSV